MASLDVKENKSYKFSPHKKIFINAVNDNLNLSEQLKRELIYSGFILTNNKEETGYILHFGYTAKRGSSQWIFKSFWLRIEDTYSGEMIYSIGSGNSYFEGVNSVIKKVTDNMTETLLKNKEKLDIALVLENEKSKSADIDETKFREILKANIDKLSPIEGIWTDYENKYTIGIKKGNDEDKYLAFILSSDMPNWKRGETKAEFYKTIYENFYSTKYYMNDKTKVGTTSYFDKRGSLIIPLKTPKGDEIKQIFIKNFPDNIPVIATDKNVDVKSSLSKYDDFLNCIVIVRKSGGLGSGFLITNDGYIITNKHVVENESTVSIKLRDGRTILGSVLSTDPKRDLALIKVEGDHFPWLTLGKITDADIGDEVIAIGTPGVETLAIELDWSVSKGIVSAIRKNLDVFGFEGIVVIQTDTPINQGNSGGPLISLKNGKVIGVNSFKTKDKDKEGLNFAVSAEEIKKAFPQYLNKIFD